MMDNTSLWISYSGTPRKINDSDRATIQDVIDRLQEIIDVNGNLYILQMLEGVTCKIEKKDLQKRIETQRFYENELSCMMLSY